MGKRDTDGRQNALWWIVGGVLVIGGVLIAIQMMSTRSSSRVGTSFKYDAQLGPRPKVKGPDSAPVKVIEFGDFQCRACGLAYKQAEPQLSALIDAGTVQVAFRHLAVVGQGSAWAAEASECAADQGTFWAYHDYLLEHQKGANEGTLSIEDLKGFAKSVVADPQKFDACLDSHLHADVIRADAEEAQRLNVREPSILINGKPIALQNNDELLRSINAVK